MKSCFHSIQLNPRPNLRWNTPKNRENYSDWFSHWLLNGKQTTTILPWCETINQSPHIHQSIVQSPRAIQQRPNHRLREQTSSFPGNLGVSGGRTVLTPGSTCSLQARRTSVRRSTQNKFNLHVDEAVCVCVCVCACVCVCVCCFNSP